MKISALCLMLVLTLVSNSQAQIWNSNYSYPVDYFTPCDSALNFFTNDSSNIWQQGTSSAKLFFGLNGTEDAIMTDSVNVYASSNHSYFDLMLPYDSYNYLCPNVEVRFLHKMETDEGKDGGYITWSPDLGTTWFSMYDNLYFGVENIGFSNLYFPEDTLEASNGYAGFTGLIDTFLETRLQFVRAYPVRMADEQRTEGFPDTILVRFNFVSDSVQTNKAGWIIKQLQVVGLDLGSFVPSVDQTPLMISVSPNPTSGNSFINYILSTSATVTIGLYDVLGNKWQQLVNANQEQGEHNTTLDTRKLANGIYLLQIHAGEQMAEQKVVVLN